MSPKALEEKKVEPSMKRLAVIRLRGRVGLKKPAIETLQFLRLHRKNHLVLIDNRTSYLGMLQRAKDYITWGEIGAETLALLLKKRGLLAGKIRLTDELVNKYTSHKTIDQFAEAITNMAAEVTELQKIKPVFRLHPPKGGFKNKLKRPVKDHGELGYRGKQIEELIKIMI